MQAKPKSNSVVTSAWDMIVGVLTLEVLGIKDKILFDARQAVGVAAYDALNDLGKRAIGHAFTQRLSDRAAIGRDKVTGQSATPFEKHSAIKALAEHYTNGGGWELAGGGLPPIQRPHLYAAVAFVRGTTAEKVESVYRDKSDEVVRTLLTISAIAGKYTELCKANAPKSDVADTLLAELDKAANGNE